MTSSASNNALSILSGDLHLRIAIWEGGETCVLPGWAESLIWLGAWCRLCQLPGKRIIVFAVLPTRELAAAFASLGCLVGGASSFVDTLSWPVFKNMPIGRSVFWEHRNTAARYCGEIVGFKERDGAEFIVVKVTKARRRVEVGFNREISRAYFDEYQFTEEKPPSQLKAASFRAVWQSLESLIENPNPKWIFADGAEALLVTRKARFENEISCLSLSIDGKPPIAMTDFSCLERNKVGSHGKLRIEHPRGALEGVFPLAILDGAQAFFVHEHLTSIPNMLVVLDRSEYQEGIHDKVLELRSVSQGSNTFCQSHIPDRFARGIELAAYVVDAQ